MHFFLPYVITAFMKAKELTLTKQLKVGLPNYSSVTVSMGLTIEVEPNEKPNYTALWEKINTQLNEQVSQELKKHITPHYEE